MAEIWTGIVDPTGINVAMGVNVGWVDRVNNTITINGMYARTWTTSSGWVADPWYNDIYRNDGGASYVAGWVSKGNTGGANIYGNSYYTSSGTWGGIGVGAYDTHYLLKVRINTSGVWRGWVGPIYLDIPDTSDPYLNGAPSASNIKPTQATVSWSASPGNYCTWTGMNIEYGLTTGYGLGNGVAAVGSQTLTGLKPGKVYHYRFYMLNGAGRAAYSADYTFKTKAVAGLAPLLMEMV